MTDHELEQALARLQAEQSARVRRKSDEANLIIGKLMWSWFGPALASTLEDHGHTKLAGDVRRSLESGEWAL